MYIHEYQAKDSLERISRNHAGGGFAPLPKRRRRRTDLLVPCGWWHGADPPGASKWQGSRCAAARRRVREAAACPCSATGWQRFPTGRRANAGRVWIESGQPAIAPANNAISPWFPDRTAQCLTVMASPDGATHEAVAASTPERVFTVRRTAAIICIRRFEQPEPRWTVGAQLISAGAGLSLVKGRRPSPPKAT